MIEGFITYEHQNLFYTYYTGDRNNAIIVLVHGLGESIYRYETWARKFNQYNYSVVGFDLYGHGRSDGKRGASFKSKDAMNALDIFIEKVKHDFPDRPIILYGHSMGGNIVAQYLTKRQPKVKAAILSSPWLDLAIKPMTIRIRMARFFSRFIPNLTQRTGINTSYISRIQEEVKKYKTDPYQHDKLSVGLFIEIYTKGRKLKKRAQQVTIPTLAFHGSGDMLTSYTATEKFASQNPLIDFIGYENGYHELHHDEVQDELLNDILDWLTVNAKYT